MSKKTTLDLDSAVSGRINVDSFDDDVWLSMHVRQASIHVVITPDEARALIAALELVIA
jgi:hypothetical protein